MMERYSHIRMEAKRKAVDTPSGQDFEPGVAQTRAQFFVSEKSDEAKSLKNFGEPGRTRTSNPLISRGYCIKLRTNDLLLDFAHPVYIQ